ncbi:hypothetical protein [Streptomyces sp. NPDC050546]|uniref:hypothetical protein n=1 Tax=Streptomyces sp. NPDC050546 TaxID=3365628 RepID=UPI00379B7615
MAADQLPGRVREFANYLDGLLARLDPSGGWCAVFWQRDPEGMRACLDGHELPPWDVVEALLQDLAGQYGPGGTGPETERARSLHAAALAAYDARPGGRDALGDRLDVMLREQKYAAERQADLTRLLASAPTREQADTLRLDLAWARDDHERATARCAELRDRMSRLDRHDRGDAAFFERRGVAPGGVPGARSAGAPVDAPGAFGSGGGAGAARAYGDGPAAGVAPRAQRAPGGPYDPGAPAMPWRPARSASGVVDDAGRHDIRHASAGPEPERPAHEHQTGRAAPREAVAGGTPGTFAAPVPAPSPAPGPGTFAAPVPAPSPAPGPGTFAAPVPAPSPAPEPTVSQQPAPKQRKRRRGSARFAGMDEEEAAPVVMPPAAVPTLPEPAPATGRTRRGARFAGAAEEAAVQHVEPHGEAGGATDRTEVARTVETLARLRAEGRSGEAHVLLVELTSSAPARFPLLAGELERAGLGADWQTLLWEAASLPAGRLVAAADALGAAGRVADGQQILRQGVARPPAEVGAAVLGLAAEGRHREVRALLDAYVRARTPEEAARSAEPDPQRLVPLLLQAAQGVSDERRWDLVHALRVAGFAA